MKRRLLIGARRARLSLAPAARRQRRRRSSCADGGERPLSRRARTSCACPTAQRLTADDVQRDRERPPGRRADARSGHARPRGSRFGVVLVIDASNSMHGSPIAAALAAARTFAHHAHPSEQLGGDRRSTGRPRRAAVHRTTERRSRRRSRNAAGSRTRHAHLRRGGQAECDARRRRTSAPARSSCSRTAPTPAARDARRGPRGSRRQANVRSSRSGSSRHAFTTRARYRRSPGEERRVTPQANPAAACADLRPARLASSRTSTSFSYRSLAGPDVHDPGVSVTASPGSARRDRRLRMSPPHCPRRPSTVYHLSVLQRSGGRTWRWSSPFWPRLCSSRAATMLLVRRAGSPLSQRMAGFVSIRSNQRSESGKLCPTGCSTASSARCEAPASGLASRRSWRSPASRCPRSRSCSGPASGPSPWRSFWPRSPARRCWGSRRWSSPWPASRDLGAGSGARGRSSRSSCRTTCR